MTPIVTTPHEVLISPAKPVAKVDKKVKHIIAEMKNSLRYADNPKGVGLAAPQIGLPVRIFIMQPKENGPIRVCVNPQIINKSQELLDGIPGKNRLEGCLSIPHVWGKVKRHKSVTLNYINGLGQEETREFTGFEAIIIQHEIDHLDGILFPRRVIEQKGTLYKPGKDEEGKDILEQLEI